MARSLRIAAIAATVVAASAINNGLGLTPPRGWRSWNLFGLKVSQQLMQEIMDGMVKPRGPQNISLASLGYKDVGLDDGWQACQKSGGFHNHSTGRPIVNTSIFPDMGGMVQYAHSKGLTAGFYGNNCWCADKYDDVSGWQGDVATLIEFGFDGYKIDSCGAQQDIALYSLLINQSSPKPIMIENCHNGPWDPQPPRKPNSPAWCPFNFYRSSTDIQADYGVVMGMNLQTTIPFAELGISFPGCWAYPDMLEVGVAPGLHKGEPGLTYTEARSHFGAWAIVSSPLVLALDVRNDTLVEQYLPVIGNSDALAINEAWAGYPGSLLLASPDRVSWAPCGFWPNCSAGAWEIWYKPLANGSVALLFLNHQDVGSAPQDVSIQWAQVPGLACASAGNSGSNDGSSSSASGGSTSASGTCNVRDVWAQKDVGPFANGYTATALAPHDSVFIIAS